jgi:hypothetical protein
LWPLNELLQRPLTIFRIVGAFKKILIVFKCPNSNTIWFNQKSKNVLEKYPSSLDMVFTLFQ